jgi:hypothetical protein
MVGFDLARTFHPSDRLGRATGVVNIGGFTASLVTIALIGVVLDQLAPGGSRTTRFDDFRIAMSVQFLFWGIGIVQLVRYRPQEPAAHRGAAPGRPGGAARRRHPAARHLRGPRALTELPSRRCRTSRDVLAMPRVGHRADAPRRESS